MKLINMLWSCAPLVAALAVMPVSCYAAQRTRIARSSNSFEHDGGRCFVIK